MGNFSSYATWEIINHHIDVYFGAKLKVEKDKIKITGSTEHFSKEDLEEIAEPLKSLFQVETRSIARLSLEALPPELIFVLGSIAAGFFGKLGADIYQKLKAAVQNRMLKFKAPLTFGFEFEIDGVKIGAYSTTDDPNIMGKALETGKQVHDFAENLIKEKRLPENMTRLYFKFDRETMGWKLEGGIRQEPWERFMFDHQTGKWSEIS